MHEENFCYVSSEEKEKVGRVGLTGNLRGRQPFWAVTARSGFESQRARATHQDFFNPGDASSGGYNEPSPGYGD